MLSLIHNVEILSIYVLFISQKVKKQHPNGRRRRDFLCTNIYSIILIDMEPDELLLYNYLKTTTPPHHESKSSTPTITDGRFKVTLIMAPLQYSTAPKLDPNHIKITLNLTYYDFSTLWVTPPSPILEMS